jgi:hypothetical protein
MNYYMGHVWNDKEQVECGWMDTSVCILEKMVYGVLRLVKSF